MTTPKGGLHRGGPGYGASVIFRPFVVFATVVGMVLIAGCGADQRGDEAARQAGRFVKALHDNDIGMACALLAPDTASHLTRPHEACRQALPELALPTGTVRETSVWSDRAQVRTDTDTLFLVELDNGWRVDAAGCTHDQADTYDCTLEPG